jgi:hypothetical protein
MAVKKKRREQFSNQNANFSQLDRLKQSLDDVHINLWSHTDLYGKLLHLDKNAYLNQRQKEVQYLNIKKSRMAFLISNWNMI